jgi:hypothetical protein
MPENQRVSLSNDRQIRQLPSAANFSLGGQTTSLMISDQDTITANLVAEVFRFLPQNMRSTSRAPCTRTH